MNRTVALRRVATIGLPGIEQRDAVVLDDADGEAFLAGLLADRITGLAAAALRAGALVASTTLVDQIHHHHLAALDDSLRSEALAVRVTGLLGDRGVEVRVLKGLAHAHLDEPDPAMRTFTDADLLIRRDDLPVALGALHATGLVRWDEPLRGWWERRFGKAATLISPDGADLDLHLSLAGGPFGARLDGRELMAMGGESFVLGGAMVTALAAPGRLLHAAYHAVCGAAPALRTWRDLAVLVLARPECVAPARLLARRWDAECVLATGLTRAWSALDLAPTEAMRWAVSHVPTPQDRALMACYRSDRWLDEGLATMRVLPWSRRPAYLAGLVLPSRAHRRRVRTRRRWPWRVG